MLDNIFKSAEKTDDVVATPVAPTPVAPTPTPAQSAVKTAPVTCTNCENSGFTCSVCGYNKP